MVLKRQHLEKLNHFVKWHDVCGFNATASLDCLYQEHAIAQPFPPSPSPNLVLLVHMQPDGGPVEVIPWTFSWHVWLCGPAQTLSLHAASATGGQQALHHTWSCHTLVCSTHSNNSTAELLTVKRIQLLLIFCMGVQPPQGVMNLGPTF